MTTLHTLDEGFRGIRRSPMLPRTPYIYFLKKRRTDYPGLEFHDVVPMLFKEWSEMSEEAKGKWKEEAIRHLQLRNTL